VIASNPFSRCRARAAGNAHGNGAGADRLPPGRLRSPAEHDGRHRQCDSFRSQQPPDRTELPYFPNLRIACGHFRTARADAEEHRRVGGYGRLDPARHFIARASGNSMNGGKNPIRDGDYLLLELVSPGNAGSITGSIMAIERQDQTGEDQYLLRVVTKQSDGSYVLVANNPDYEDIHVTPEMAEELRTLARLKAVIDPLELAVGESFMREEIPCLFGAEFNPGKLERSGHVVLPERNAHVLFVTLNKQGKAEEHRYLDRWIDEHTFQWSSQNATTPDSKTRTGDHRASEPGDHTASLRTRNKAGWRKGSAVHVFREGSIQDA
jgi:SOS-response transcriptional repressor LexA